MKEEPNQNSQPQYEKYIKCHVYRIHLGTFGNHCCDHGSGGGCGCGDGQAGHGCIGPGDPPMPGAGPNNWSYSELMTDQAPCMDFEDVCTPRTYAYDCMNGNKKYDHGLITDDAPCSIGSDKGPLSICYA